MELSVTSVGPVRQSGQTACTGGVVSRENERAWGSDHRERSNLGTLIAEYSNQDREWETSLRRSTESSIPTFDVGPLLPPVSFPSPSTFLPPPCHLVGRSSS
jgi:hypothetical protein